MSRETGTPGALVANLGNMGGYDTVLSPRIRLRRMKASGMAGKYCSNARENFRGIA